MCSVQTTFVVLSEDLTPADIERRLGEPPDNSFCRGDSIEGTTRKRTKNGYRITLKTKDILAIATQVAELLERLRGVREQVRHLVDEGCNAKIVIVAYDIDSNFSLELDAALLQDIAYMRSSLWIDAYYFPGSGTDVSAPEPARKLGN